MQGSEILLELTGAVALLVWATRMVRTGVERAYGARLKSLLGRAFSNRMTSALGGLGLAFLLQSSTAVVLMTTGFVSAGYLAAVPAVAAAVGADLGSALLAVVLRADLSVLVPILLIAGIAAFRSTERPMWRQWGRILFGLGLLLLSLRLIGEAAAPLRDSSAVPVVLSLVRDDPVMLFLFAALAAWAFHSTLAAVLVAALLAENGVLPAGLILPVVLGINLGGGIMALALARGTGGPGRIVPLANLALRGGLATCGLAALTLGAPDPLTLWPLEPGLAVVAGHVGVNLAIAILGLALAGPLCRAIGQLTDRAAPPPMDRLSALAEADLATPAQALRNAGREAGALCGVIETMLARLPDLIRTGQDTDFAALEEADRLVDRRFDQIKTYLARIETEKGNPRQEAELARLQRVAVRLEQVGDVIAQRVVVRARKRRDRGAAFSDTGWAEISGILAELMVTVRLAANLVASGDLGLARRLVEQKAIVRGIERQSTDSHFDRLREGRLDTRSSSTLHLDILYDLKEINSLLVEIGYPMLEADGLLRPDRLAPEGQLEMPKATARSPATDASGFARTAPHGSRR